MNIRLLPLALAGCLIAGCAQVKRGEGFADVRDNVEQRTGRQVHWYTGGPEDSAVAHRVEALLADPLSPDAAVQVALLNNRNLQAVYEDLGIAQADVVKAGLLRNPIFSGEVRFAEAGAGQTIELRLVQDFIDILYIPLRKRIAEAEFERVKLRIAASAVNLAGDVRVALLDHQADRQVTEMRRSIRDATALSFDLAQRIHKAGNITDLQLANERVLHEQAKLDLAAAEMRETESREALNTLMGLWGEASARWKPVERLADPPDVEVELSDVEKRSVAASLDLALIRSEQIAALRRLDLARPLAIAPDAEVGLSAEREVDHEWSLGPELSIPIPLFNQGQAEAAIRSGEFRRAEHRLHAQAVEVRSAARMARARLTSARQRALYIKQVILPLRRSITDETQKRNNAMLAGAFELLAAKQAEIAAGADYIAALRDYWIARANFEQLMAGTMPSSGRQFESFSKTMNLNDRGGH